MESGPGGLRRAFKFFDRDGGGTLCHAEIELAPPPPPPPRHTARDQSSGLTEIYLRCAIPMLLPM
jgi:hypothetical protein